MSDYPLNRLDLHASSSSTSWPPPLSKVCSTSSLHLIFVPHLVFIVRLIFQTLHSLDFNPHSLDFESHCVNFDPPCLDFDPHLFNRNSMFDLCNRRELKL